jgi:hypothetical protein
MLTCAAAARGTYTARHVHGRFAEVAMTLLRILAVAAIAIAGATAALPADAQSPGGPGGGGRGGGGPGGGMGGPGGDPRSVTRGAAPATTGSPMVQVQLDQLEDALRLTPEQRPAWNTYADKVVRLMDDVARSRLPAPPAQIDAPAQLERLTDTARVRLAAIEEIAEAGKKLYPLLSKEQQALADRQLVSILAPALGGSPSGSFGPPRGRP